MKKILCKMGIGTCQEEKTMSSSEVTPAPSEEAPTPKKEPSQESSQENPGIGPFGV